jgi:predicted alpha/beta superfamily hydrolase
MKIKIVKNAQRHGEIWRATKVNSRKIFLTVLSIGVSVLWLQMQVLPFPALAGQIQNRSTVKVYSQILEEERTIYVTLPDGYEASGKTYPVLVVLDAEGNSLFQKCVSTLNDLHAKAFLPDMIVVGIWNTNRNRDMIPEAVSHRPGSGGSENFLRFITDELKPEIQKKYRASDYSILYGMSNSALFAVYTLLVNPEAFDAVVASSPMIGHCPDFIAKKRETFIKQKLDKQLILYMIYGNEDSRRVTAYVPAFQNAIDSHAPKGFTSKLEILDGEGHVPDSSLEKGLRYIFSR